MRDSLPGPKGHKHRPSTNETSGNGEFTAHDKPGRGQLAMTIKKNREGEEA